MRVCLQSEQHLALPKTSMVLEAIQHFFFEKSWLVKRAGWWLWYCVGSVRWSAQVDDVGNIPFGQTGDNSAPWPVKKARILLKGTTSLPA